MAENGSEEKAFKADLENDFQTEDGVTEAAGKSFGIKYLYSWQRLVVGNILDASAEWERQEKLKAEGKAVEEEELNDIVCNGRQIVLLPTGAGKSLCFLTPALLLPGTTLVLYPLLALMADQKRRMDEGNLQAVIFKGGQSDEERQENFRKLKEGARIILANPEVLQNESLVKQLSLCRISHIAIDEAHCVSEWGDTFRPAYLTLGKIIKELKVPVITAFTATASPEVLARVAEVLFEGKAHLVRSDSDRPNIHYNVVNAFAKKRAAFRLAVTLPKPLIVFCGTRNNSEEMARELSIYYGDGRVKFYHAGMTKEEKDAVEKWFYPKTDGILCCTCAFGMGVDKKDIHTVVHWIASPTAESYIQEAGRGGRDGSVATAWLVWSPEDSEKAGKFPENSRERVLKKFAESSTCRREVLLEALGDHLNWCDGCDVCERKGPAPFAEDAAFAISFLRKHKKYYTKDCLRSELLKEFNSRDIRDFNFNIWENSDIEEILQSLEKQKLIRKCKWPWKERYTVIPHLPLYSRLHLPFFLQQQVSGQQQASGGVHEAFFYSVLHNLPVKHKGQRK